jgi:isoquinoline 1-oxidoreductase subunit beta
VSDDGRVSRRAFLKAGATIGAGLAIAFYLPPRLARWSSAPSSPLGPDGWIQIDTDGIVTLALDRTEMGQGVMTALPMILAEELEADWETIRVAPLVVNPAGWVRDVGTGASWSVRGSYDDLRHAGAAAREMLVAAAALAWNVDPSSCRAERGFVTHPPSGRRLGYGDLVSRASALEVPRAPRLKDPSEFRLIGKPVRRLDTPSKVNGTAKYGIDVRVPGMLFASIERSPVFGGTLRAIDDAGARRTPGVRRVVRLAGRGRRHARPGTWRTYTEEGVAVLADSYWQAWTGRRALKIDWDEGPNASLDSGGLRARFVELARRDGAVARQDGDSRAALAGCARVVEAVYELPFLHQATMEPMNCTAHVQADGCDVWAPLQKQTEAQLVAAEVAGLPLDRVRIHTTLLGGGFGRRQENDFVAEAVSLSKATGAPVQVIWTREDDVRHGFYRPAVYNALAAGLDAAGHPVAWTHRVVGPSIAEWKFARLPGGLDKWLVEGAADLPYAIPNVSVSHEIAEVPVPRGFWRSTGASHNTFVTECFFDEVARAAGRDPYELRRELLRDHPRHLAVLDLAADRAGWGRALPEGRFRGIAVVNYADAFVAEVAELSLSDRGTPTVHRVVCAVDCGPVVNPDIVAAQMEGGVAFGLSAVLYGEISLERGRVKQSNFHDYRLVRMAEMPVVETYIVPSNEKMGAIGDPAVPAVAPAICNAIHAATGTPVRRLPLLPAGT